MSLAHYMYRLQSAATEAVWQVWRKSDEIRYGGAIPIC